jgi:hypothetical protein
MFIQYKRQVDFSPNIIDANLGYDGLITYAKCKGVIPTNINKFQEGCLIAKIDAVNNSTEIYYNSGVPSAPIWTPIGGAVPSVTINAPYPGIAIASGATTIDSIAYGANGTVLTMVAGLPVFSPIPSGESTTVSDTNSIDLTITGTDITADIKLSATVPNLATIAVDGLLVQETITTLTDNADGTYTYISEDGTSTTIGDGSIVIYTDAVTGTAHKIGDLFDQTGTPTVVNETITTYIDDVTGHHIGYYVDETGAGYGVTESITNIQNTVVGHKIADYTNEQTNVIDINETVTTLAQSLATGVITFTAEDASVSTVNVVSTDANNSIVVGTDGGAFYNAPALVTGATWDDATNTIEITFDDASVVNIPIVDNISTFLSDFTISDGTNTDVVSNHETLTFTAGNGITQLVAGNSLTTTAKLSTDAGNNLSFGTDNGLMLDVSAFADNIYTADGTVTSNRTAFLDDKSLVFNTTNRDLISMSFTGVENVDIDAEILTLGKSVIETRLGTFNSVNTLATVGQVLVLQDAITSRVEYQDISSLLPSETEEYFDAQSGATVVLANTPAVGTVAMVMKNGQVLRNGATRDYTIAGATITFNVTLVSDDIHVIYKF